MNILGRARFQWRRDNRSERDYMPARWNLKSSESPGLNLIKNQEVVKIFRSRKNFPITKTGHRARAEGTHDLPAHAQLIDGIKTKLPHPASAARSSHYQALKQSFAFVFMIFLVGGRHRTRERFISEHNRHRRVRTYKGRYRLNKHVYSPAVKRSFRVSLSYSRAVLFLPPTSHSPARFLIVM